MLRTPIESDPRFPGGTWVGYFLLPPDGHTRHSSVAALSFAKGVLSGSGSDEDGAFSVCGRYDPRDGKCI